VHGYSEDPQHGLKFSCSFPLRDVNQSSGSRIAKELPHFRSDALWRPMRMLAANQGDWRVHLEARHLDPELFAYQLRMNLDEGGVNEIFNELKENKDFIPLYLELGLDPETPTQVRNNLSEFLPQHRRLEAMRAQVAFNDLLLVELKLFLDQLGLFCEAESRARAAGDAASRPAPTCGCSVSSHANSASASAPGSNHHAGFCRRSQRYAA